MSGHGGRRAWRRPAAAAAAAAVLAAVAGPAAAANAGGSTARQLGERLARAVTVDRIHRHLVALQRIADRNGGDRADPTPGFRESLDYVARAVRGAGFHVTVQPFTYDRTVVDAAVLAAGGHQIVPHHMFGSPPTPVGGVTGRLAVVPPDATTGCEAADYAGLDVVGALVLIRRGGCTFAQKEQVAAAAGAIAAVVYNNSPGPMGGAVDPLTARIPTVGLVGVDGAALAALPGVEVTLDVRDHLETTVSYNLLAQTRTGRTDNVVMAGAHLDSIPGTPGINENGSSVAALLETALRLGSAPRVRNAVRFAWWGADWANTGSAAYLTALGVDERRAVALYLEFEAIGSLNGGYFVYDGDGSSGLGSGPAGSGRIEQDFVDYFARRGIPTEPTNYPGRGAYSDFIEAGVPTGGLFAGLFLFKSEAQAAKWGGAAGIPFDPNNHGPQDNLGNINRRVLDRNADAMAFAVGGYAMSTAQVTSTAQADRVPAQAGPAVAAGLRTSAATTTPKGPTA
ncbi:MAG TPA: M28 family peptidase [Pilimelia sp.]|nr:M28 family peptidase [Pilimelia sp.]